MRIQAAIILLLGFGSMGEASPYVVRSFESNILYEIDKNPDHRGSVPNQLDQIFSHLSFHKLERGRLARRQALSFVQRIYLSKAYQTGGDQRLVFILSGVEIRGAVQYGEFYQHPKGVILHLPSDIRHEDTVVFLTGFSQDSLRDLQDELKKSLNVGNASPKAREWVGRQATPLLAPKMFGGSLLRPTSVNLMNSLKPISAVEIALRLSVARADSSDVPAICSNNSVATAQPMIEPSVLANAWECTKGLAQGFWDMTVGPVVFAAESVYKYAFRPIELLSQVDAEFSRYVGFMRDIGDTFDDARDLLKSLPPEALWNVGCELSSALATAGAWTYFTVGGGTPLGLKGLSIAFGKLAERLPKGSSVSNRAAALASKFGSKAQEAVRLQELLSAGVSGRRFATLINRIDGAAAQIRSLEVRIPRLEKSIGIEVGKTETLRTKAARVRAGERLTEHRREMAQVQGELRRQQESLRRLLEERHQMIAQISEIPSDGAGLSQRQIDAAAEKLMREMVDNRSLKANLAEMNLQDLGNLKIAVALFLGTQLCTVEKSVRTTIDSSSVSKPIK